MNRAVLVVATLAAISSTASAGTYIGAGIGTAPAMNDETDALDSGGRALKALVGYSFKTTTPFVFSIEGALGGNSVIIMDRAAAIPYGDYYHVSAAGKFTFPLGSGFEAFGRAGIQRAWLNANGDNTNFRSGQGNGLLIGGGFEYRLKFGSIFVDYQINRVNIADDVDSRLDNRLTTRIWTLGMTFGL